MWLDDRGPTWAQRKDEAAWVTFAVLTGIETTADVYGEAITVTRGYMYGVLVTLVYAGEKLIGHTHVACSYIDLVADIAYKGMLGGLKVLYISSESFQEMRGQERRLK